MSLNYHEGYRHNHMMNVKLQYVTLRQAMENQSRFSSYAGMKYMAYVCGCFDQASFFKTAGIPSPNKSTEKDIPTYCIFSLLGNQTK